MAPPFVCAMTHLHVIWLIHMCDVTHSYVPWHIYMWYDLFICVTWHIHMWHNSSECVMWLFFFTLPLAKRSSKGWKAKFSWPITKKWWVYRERERERAELRGMGNDTRHGPYTYLGVFFFHITTGHEEFRRMKGETCHGPLVCVFI